MYESYILSVNIQYNKVEMFNAKYYHAMPDVRVNTANNLAPYGCHSLFVVINLNALRYWCAH